MGRRYYCDYCDKSFIDDLGARKKHLSSAHHIKLRKIHYELERHPKKVLEEESVKPLCRRFLQTGNCMFIGNCKYTHYRPEELYELKTHLDEYEQQKTINENNETIPSVDSWLKKYYEKNTKEAEADTNFINTSWTYPEHLANRTDLTPSLKKFAPEDFTDSNFEEWGK